MKKILFTLIFIGLNHSVYAQTHPCDQVVVPNPNLTSPVKVGFCHTGKESDNITSIAAWHILLDSTPLPVFNGSLIPIGVASTSGLFYYETPTFVVIRGQHSIIVVGTDSTGAEVTTRSVNIPFGVINLPAVAPSNGRIKK